MKKQHVAQQKPSRPQWHQTLYAYHEAGHAVVDHAIGRCISEISIGAASSKGYKGYCQFSNYAEVVHDLPQWGTESQNPERITVLYGGTVAMRFLCQERGGTMTAGGDATQEI